MASATKKKYETKNPIDHVQIEGLVVLKIIKHCQEEGSGLVDVAQGVLLGLAMDNRLEITNSFPYPRHTDDDEVDEMEYQMEMMRHLRHVNVDHFHVGWYQSTHYGGSFNKILLDSQYSYQSSIEESVVLIYDPVKTSRGFLSLKAYRLSDQAMNLYNNGEFPIEGLKTNSISYDEIFEEIPIVVKNSTLINILQCEIEPMIKDKETMQFLDLGTASVLEKNLQGLMECIDSTNQETNKLHNYQRQVTKQAQAKSQFIMKRHQENAQRAEKGDPPLPEEDLTKLFKPIPHPSRMETLLLCGQINNFSGQITGFSAQNMAKLYLAEAFQHPQEVEEPAE